MSKIYPLILCGGSGSRLWPVSRAGGPKQFQSIHGNGGMSLFQETVQRHRTDAFADPIIVTSIRHLRGVVRQLDEIQCEAHTIISEPVARNTGPAVLAAALSVLKSDPEATLLVLPSDHVIEGDMNTRVLDMRKAANDGRIVTFGIAPTYPETGFGYILDGGRYVGYDHLHRVEAFIEKPPLARAQSLMQTGQACWASGISMFRADTIVQEYGQFDAATLRAVTTAVERADQTAHGPVLEQTAFSAATSLPTESAIFENSPAVAMTRLQVKWSDVGSWSAIHDIGQKTEDGNVLQGDVVAIDTKNALIRSDDRLVAVVGLSDVVVIDTADAVLVTSQAQSQQVKTLVEQLKTEDRRETVDHIGQNHSWGESRRIVRSPSCEMTVLRVKSGFSLELDGFAGTQVIAVSGQFAVNGAVEYHQLENGDRFVSDGSGRLRLVNMGDQTGEALIIVPPTPKANAVPPLKAAI